MYPDDPRPDLERRKTGKEQVVVVLIALGVAVMVTLLGGVLLYVARMLQ
mgnify:FL=1